MHRSNRSLVDNLFGNLHQITHRRIIDYRIRQREEHIQHLERRITKLAETLIDIGAINQDVYNEAIAQLSDIDKDSLKAIERQIHSFWHSFREGFRKGLGGIIAEKITKYLNEVLVRAFTKKNFETAWIHKGFVVYAYFDKLYMVSTDRWEDVLKTIYATCRYADRYVRLIEGLEGYCKAFAHEYLSFLRELRCHLSQVSIKITPLTMKVLYNERGQVYCATHIDAKVLTYSPYSRRIYPMPPYYEILLRRKPDIRFSSRIDSGNITVADVSDIVTARDYADRPYMVRKLINVLFRPMVILKDKARSLGMPEQSHNLHTCSIYFIPRRTKSSRYYNIDDPKIRVLSKPNIYIRTPKI